MFFGVGEFLVQSFVNKWLENWIPFETDRTLSAAAGCGL